MLKPRKKPNSYSHQEDVLIFSKVEEAKRLKLDLSAVFTTLADELEGRTESGVRQRYWKLLKAHKEGKWSPDETSEHQVEMDELSTEEPSTEEPSQEPVEQIETEATPEQQAHIDYVPAMSLEERVKFLEEQVAFYKAERDFYKAERDFYKQERDLHKDNYDKLQAERDFIKKLLER